MKALAGALVLSLLQAVSAPPADAQSAAPPEGEAGRWSSLWRDARPSGLWRTHHFHSSKTFDDDEGFTGSTLQLEVLPAFTESIDGKLEVRITNPALNEGGEPRTRVLEGYATVRFARADLRLGRQIVPWGRADGINPTDNLTPRDYTLLLPFEEDQRFGVTAAKLDAFLSQEHTLTVVATPFFEPARVPLPAGDGAVIGRRPADTLSNTKAGVRLNKVGEGLDWSVSWFRGFSLLPSLRVTDSDPRARALALHYDRITAFGADVARNYGRFGFRGEVAWFDTADDAGTDPAVKNAYLHWIVGVDRTLLANLNVNLQFFQRRVRDWHDPEDIVDPRARDTALLNALVDGQRDAVGNGFTFRVSNKWRNDTLEAEIFGVVNTTRHDRLLRPLVTYAITDHWKGTIGAEIYHGARDTQYGSLEPNRGAFLELRYGF
jgi:hypothetical protein